jgi:hypothetical protein
MQTMTKKAQGKVALYVEVPPKVKAAMEKLAEQHNRSVAGEVITALQAYIAQQQRRQAEEGGDQ